MKKLLSDVGNATHVLIGGVGAVIISAIFYWIDDKIVGTLSSLLVISIIVNIILFFVSHKRNDLISAMSPKIIMCREWGDEEQKFITLLSEPSEFFGMGDRVNLFYLDSKMEIKIGSAVVHNVQTDRHVQFLIEKMDGGQNHRWGDIKVGSNDVLSRIKIRTTVNTNAGI